MTSGGCLFVLWCILFICFPQKRGIKKLSFPVTGKQKVAQVGWRHARRNLNVPEKVVSSHLAPVWSRLRDIFRWDIHLWTPRADRTLSFSKTRAHETVFVARTRSSRGFICWQVEFVDKLRISWRQACRFTSTDILTAGNSKSKKRGEEKLERQNKKKEEEEEDRCFVVAVVLILAV